MAKIEIITGQDGNQYMLVSVPKNIPNNYFYFDFNILKAMKSNGWEITLPEGYKYSSPVLCREMSEDDKLGIVESWNCSTGGDDFQDYYENYLAKDFDERNPYEGMPFMNVEESFASLLQSLGFKIDCTLLIKCEKI